MSGNRVTAMLRDTAVYLCLARLATHARHFDMNKYVEQDTTRAGRVTPTPPATTPAPDALSQVTLVGMSFT